MSKRPSERFFDGLFRKWKYLDNMQKLVYSYNHMAEIVLPRSGDGRHMRNKLPPVAIEWRKKWKNCY